ncbi:MAG: hypothetical protein ACLRH4_16325 [Anaerobutyricum hallii]
MKIREFIDRRNVSYDTVRKFIINHPELFKGHIGKSKNIILDDEAVRLLEEKYPLPSPVQVIQDASARERLQEIEAKYINLLEENNRLIQEMANLKLVQYKQRFLEESVKQKDYEIEELYSKLEREKAVASEENKKLKEELANKEKQLEIEKNKSWWDKLRGR